MKPNIDLTLNRDFGKKRFDFRLIDRVLGARYPWDRILKVRPVYSLKSNGLLPTGTKSERGDRRYEWEMDNSCQRCGTPLRKFPWNRFTDLCKSCDETIRIDVSDDLFLKGLKK